MLLRLKKLDLPSSKDKKKKRPVLKPKLNRKDLRNCSDKRKRKKPDLKLRQRRNDWRSLKDKRKRRNKKCTSPFLLLKLSLLVILLEANDLFRLATLLGQTI